MDEPHNIMVTHLGYENTKSKYQIKIKNKNGSHVKRYKKINKSLKAKISF